MSSISGAGYSIDLSKVKQFDIASAAVRKLTDEEKAKFEKIREMMYAQPSNLDELKNHVSQKPYAEVVVDGKVVATLYNSGAAQTSNAAYVSIKNLASMGEDEQSTGPELAQKRAEEIAKALGGQVVQKDTAVTQAEYLSTPAFRIKYKIDYAAMERDRAAAIGQVSTAQTLADTQTLGESSLAGGTSAADAFLDFTSKSWEERMRVMILNSLGLKEEDLANMTPEELEKVEAKIKEKIEEEIEKKTGMSVSTAAAAA